MKQSLIRNLFLALGLLAGMACQKVVHNTEELVDPWTRERTPINFRLEKQIGAAVITDDWQHDTQGSISVGLMTAALDLSAVKVEALDFRFPDSEFCPTASISVGSTLDLSSGTASFTVTAYNGETRTYTISYTAFKDPLEGTYSFTPVEGILDSDNAPASAMVVIGGWDGNIVASTVMDKWWHWGTGYKPTDEDDNILSFKMESADAATGTTFGTVVNTPGPDGLYANYLYGGTRDINEQYRLIPEGKARWSKPGDGFIYIYAYEDTEYATPLHSLVMLEAGEYNYAERAVVVPHLALARVFPGPLPEPDYNFVDERWFITYLRYAAWLVKQDSTLPLDNHDTYLE